MNLNRSAKADKASLAMRTAVSVNPLSEQTAECARLCCELNYGFTSGRNGILCMAAYTEMIFDFSDRMWQTWRMDGSHLFDAALKSILPMVASWWR